MDAEETSVRRLDRNAEQEAFEGRGARACQVAAHLSTEVCAVLANTEASMRRALRQVVSTLATNGAHREIGVCQDCTHFGREMCGALPSTSLSAAECLLLRVPIQPEDAGLLCVHFQPKSEHRDGGNRE